MLHSLENVKLGIIGLGYVGLPLAFVDNFDIRNHSF